MKILGVSGSLRAASRNTTVPGALEGVTLFDGLRELPPFDPDRQAADAPLVARWREAVRAADAVLFRAPEYALDHLVGSGELSGKPVGVPDAAPHSRFAPAQLRETLRTMDAAVVEAACATVRPEDAEGSRAVVTSPSTPR